MTVAIIESGNEQIEVAIVAGDIIINQGGGGGATQPTAVNFTNQTEVQVLHNKGYKPLVNVLDSSGNEIVAAIEHTSVNNFYARFNSAFSGTILHL